ncbi:hypothetical protein E2C01_062479 [Portunus trituberculatus]|uniref:Uncharacterized protein n=1 Tax=Portunus trituberculatus TaxID=210409 RepID=A0A5B7H6J3_PORTR|nr:hypothetical protein [Portunus trituberculatus]
MFIGHFKTVWHVFRQSGYDNTILLTLGSAYGVFIILIPT